MEPELHVFATYESTGNALGLANAWDCAVNLRRSGYTTKLTTEKWGPTYVHVLVATPPAKPTRAERGCWTKENRNVSATID